MKGTFTKLSIQTSVNNSKCKNCDKKYSLKSRWDRRVIPGFSLELYIWTKNRCYGRMSRMLVGYGLVENWRHAISRLKP
jgi:hypothetical protein